MSAGVVVRARPMLLVAAALFVAWGLGLNVPYAESGGIHLLLIAAVAVALAAFTLARQFPGGRAASRWALTAIPQPRAQSIVNLRNGLPGRRRSGGLEDAQPVLP